MYKSVSFAADLLRKAYPDFVYGKECAGVPIFCMHGVTEHELEAQLSFLAENGYRTITADEYLDGDTDRAVMLTYDDGWGSLWSVGMPIVEKYGAKIVVFLAAGRLGKSGIGELGIDRDNSSTPLLTWDEVSAMHSTGLVDFQSHSLTHARVFDSPKIIDYVSPDYLSRTTIFGVPEWNGKRPALGRPVYTSSPRLVATRYVEDPHIKRACEEYVRKLGGEQFFRYANWHWQLDELVKWHRKTEPDLSEYESADDRRRELLAELVESKRLVEEHLPGKVVRHLCYPWHAYSDEVRELSLAAGYATNYLGKLDGRYFGAHSGPPVMVARVGGDFFFRLPGRERRPLLGVLAKKLTR